MENKIKNLVLSLEKLPEDIRDFSHHLIFGTTAPVNLPTFDFEVSPFPPKIYDQTDLDFCTGESSAAESTVEFRVESDASDPLFQFAKIKQIRGEWQSPGANLRDAANALVKFGSLPLSKSPFTHRTGKPTDQSRDFLANWANWPKELDTIAQNRRLGSYFAVDGNQDAFDNIRSALWQNASTWAGSGVIFGILWRPEWVHMQRGVIMENYQTSAGAGHAVYLRGQKMIDSVPYIVCQNSWGTQYGDNGLFYFPRNVINTESANGYGAFVFKKIPVSVIKKFINNIKP